MTRISIFAGPSLERTDSNADDVWFGPAAAGDMLALATLPPHKVLLIDGLFESARAPWHKEILVLLSKGFEVWGTASFGALRAVELARFGMRPFGAVARAVADGRIIGDDEVAVVHAPGTLGYRPLTIAHVDVRATLVEAMRRRMLHLADARRIAALSRRIFYKDRTLEALIDRILSARDIQNGRTFASWLPGGLVLQKQIDAQDALRCLRSATFVRMSRPPPPETVFLRRLRAER